MISMKKNVKDDILKLLQKHPEGLTITNVSNLLGINYMTVSKYLAVLEALGEIQHMRVGMAKLFKLTVSK